MIIKIINNSNIPELHWIIFKRPLTAPLLHCLVPEIGSMTTLSFSNFFFRFLRLLLLFCTSFATSTERASLERRKRAKSAALRRLGNLQSRRSYVFTHIKKCIFPVTFLQRPKHS